MAKRILYATLAATLVSLSSCTESVRLCFANSNLELQQLPADCDEVVVEDSNITAIEDFLLPERPANLTRPGLLVRMNTTLLDVSGIRAGFKDVLIQGNDTLIDASFGPLNSEVLVSGNPNLRSLEILLLDTETLEETSQGVPLDVTYAPSIYVDRNPNLELLNLGCSSASCGIPILQLSGEFSLGPRIQVDSSTSISSVVILEVGAGFDLNELSQLDILDSVKIVDSTDATRLDASDLASVLRQSGFEGLFDYCVAEACESM